MEYVTYFSFKIFLLIFHVGKISKVQNHNVDKLMIDDTDLVCEIQPLCISYDMIWINYMTIFHTQNETQERVGFHSINGKR